MSIAVANSTRALDHPDVPLVISSVQFAINIILDLLIISKFHVGSFKPTINTQALIRMTCDLASAGCGLAYFIFLAFRMQHSREAESPRSPQAMNSPLSPSSSASDPLSESQSEPKPGISISALRTLIRTGIWTFLESALRNAIYLWLIHGIVSMGLDYATAWGVFNNIRWGIVMVPVNAIEASTSAFVGHAWGAWRKSVGADVRKPKAGNGGILSKFPFRFFHYLE